MNWLFSILFLFASTAAMAQTFTTMSYNLRYDAPSDGPNNWHHRKAALASQVQFYAPDFLGTQEGLAHQVNYLDSALDTYAYIGVGRDDGKAAGEYAALFYRTDRVDLLQQGTFWLSETPDKVSVGWDAALPRVCTYGQFRQGRRGHVLWVFNAHFDHRGAEAREQSARLIRQKAEELAGPGALVIIMGDFNAAPETAPMQEFFTAFEDAAACADCIVHGTRETFNAFDPGQSGQHARIDYILHSAALRVTKYAAFSDLIDGRYISDHMPVYAELRLQN